MQEDELAQILANIGEYAQPLSPLGLHIEEEPKEHSAQDKNAPEKLHNEEEKEENHSIHDVSMTGEKSDEDIEEEQSTPGQTTSQEKEVT